MKIITAPSVRVVGYTQFIPHPEYEIPTDLSGLDQLPVFAARGCYDSFLPNGRPTSKGTLENVLDVGHGSVLEHSHISFFIEGISRGCSHEIVRHRHFNFSQRSTRYTSEEDAAIVLDPYYAELFGRMHLDNMGAGQLQMPQEDYNLIQHFLNSCETALHEYRIEVNHLIQSNPFNYEGKELRKWARGKARQLLPHALETRMTMTGNLRCWRDFIALRAQPDAEAEIRRLAFILYDLLKEWAPISFSDFLDMRHQHNAISPKVRKV